MMRFKFLSFFLVPWIAFAVSSQEDVQKHWETLQKASWDCDAMTGEALASLITHPNQRIARLAMEVSAWCPKEEAKAVLVEVVQGDPAQAPYALRVLMAYHDPSLIPLAQAQLKPGGGMTAIAAQWLLYDLGEGDQEILFSLIAPSQPLTSLTFALSCIAFIRNPLPFQDKLLGYLKDPRDEVRAAAASGCLGLANKKVQKALVSMIIRETYHYVRLRGMEILLRQKPLPKDTILTLLSTPRVASFLAELMVKSHKASLFFPPLDKALSSGHAELITPAKLLKLPELGKKLLNPACDKKASPEFIRGAIQYWIEAKKEPIKPCLSFWLNHPNPGVLSYAIWLIGAFHWKDHAQAVIQAFKVEDPEVLMSAAWSAGEMGMKEAIPLIKPLLHHPNPEVVRYAREALQKLGGLL